MFVTRTQLNAFYKQVLHTSMDLLFPIYCIGCEKESLWMCQNCLDAIPIHPAKHCPFCETKTPFGNTCTDCVTKKSIDGAYSCVPYAHPHIQSLIHTWKYSGIKAITPLVGTILIHSLNHTHRFEIDHPFLQKDILLCPIPLHAKKMSERGFNQAEALAKCIAAHAQTWEYKNLLIRNKRTAAQATLTGADRVLNMQHAFSLDRQYVDVIQKRNIVLIDDVITTGNTGNEAGVLLRQAGAQSVWVLTLAYGHPK